MHYYIWKYWLCPLKVKENKIVTVWILFLTSYCIPASQSSYTLDSLSNEYAFCSPSFVKIWHEFLSIEGT